MSERKYDLRINETQLEILAVALGAYLQQPGINNDEAMLLAGMLEDIPENDLKAAKSLADTEGLNALHDLTL